jgi:hypothetical protein
MVTPGLTVFIRPAEYELLLSKGKVDQGKKCMSSIDAIAGRITSTFSLFETSGAAAIYSTNLVTVIRPIHGGGPPGCQNKSCSHGSNEGSQGARPVSEICLDDVNVGKFYYSTTSRHCTTCTYPAPS